jgi:hypothetical protein
MVNDATNKRPGSITVTVQDSGAMGGVLTDAYVYLYRLEDEANADIEVDVDNWDPVGKEPCALGRTDDEGKLTFPGLASGHYIVVYGHYVPNQNGPDLGFYADYVKLRPGCPEAVCFALPFNVTLDHQLTVSDSGCYGQIRVGDCLHVKVGFAGAGRSVSQQHVKLQLPRGASPLSADPYSFTLPIRSAGQQQIAMALQFARLPMPSVAADESKAAARSSSVSPVDAMASYAIKEGIDVVAREPAPIVGNVNVSMTRTETEPTDDVRLWAAIRSSTESLSYDHYARFMEQLFCNHDNKNAGSAAEKDMFRTLLGRRALPFNDTDAYRVMKAATEAFVIVNCGVYTGERDIDTDPVLADLLGYLDRRDLPRPVPQSYRKNVDGIKMLPYLAIIRRKLPDVSFSHPGFSDAGLEADLCEGFVKEKLNNPCMVELIWSYWHEEGMQVQTMNAITRRFQNVRGPGQADPLANLEVNPLRPLNNLIWGCIQDEQHRLSVARRNYEYDHHYGLRLEGRAVQNFRPADTRSKFIEGFHHLLRLCTVFYRQDDDTTVKADAFGVLNALKELHLIISQGAHSQFGDLPPTARIEMLMQQWMLAHAEFREFLPMRAMVAYPEPWMDRVDAMKTLQGWTDTSVMHFHNLGVFGEQIVLSIRYGDWSVVFEPTQAFNFARFWRPQVQGYIHAYRAATGVDLSIDARNPVAEATMPSVLLRQRLDQQARSA